MYLFFRSSLKKTRWLIFLKLCNKLELFASMFIVRKRVHYCSFSAKKTKSASLSCIYKNHLLSIVYFNVDQLEYSDVYYVHAFKRLLRWVSGSRFCFHYLYVSILNWYKIITCHYNRNILQNMLQYRLDPT